MERVRMKQILLACKPLFKVFLYIIIVIAGLFLSKYFIDFIFDYNNKGNVSSSKAKGVCYFKYNEVEGCIEIESIAGCKEATTLSGAIFEKFSPNEQINDKCYENKATHAFLDNFYKHYYLKEFYFPIRSVLNYNSVGPSILSNKNIAKRYVSVVYFFIVSFLTLLYFRRKYDFISIPFIILVSSFISCFFLSLENLTGGFQLYVKISDQALLLSDIIIYCWFLYAFLYFFILLVYHTYKFDKGEISPLLMNIIIYVDKLKSKLNF